MDELERQGIAQRALNPVPSFVKTGLALLKTTFNFKEARLRITAQSAASGLDPRSEESR